MGRAAEGRDNAAVPRTGRRRWSHVELGDDAASFTMDVRVDEITGVRFVRGPYPFPSFPGREVLTVESGGQAGERAGLLRAGPV
jgi:hypothetical protein